ncbi:MAG: hypothetical protein NZ874_09760 [Fimbriimonadales bacterium]|nr:hypothetical protein [Fimbriimonadales bacterium]
MRAVADKDRLGLHSNGFSCRVDCARGIACIPCSVARTVLSVRCRLDTTVQATRVGETPTLRNSPARHL